MKFQKFKEVMNEEHGGFAVTIEVLASLVMFTTFLTFTLYMLRVMDVQRYMNTVMTSTASQASRWGGVNTKAYSDNVSNVPLLASAQEQLNYVASDFNPRISGTPSKIQNSGDKITISISYSLPSVFSTMSKVSSSSGSYDTYSTLRNMSMKVSVNSIMEAGKLL